MNINERTYIMAKFIANVVYPIYGVEVEAKDEKEAEEKILVKADYYFSASSIKPIISSLEEKK
jgi:hypothetical protein